MEASQAYRHIHFAVMAVEGSAIRLGISGREMEERLQKQGLISGRLFRHYDMLHTQSLDYVTEDTVEALQNWEKYSSEHL